GSNLRPPVLETGALPIELHSYGGPASPPIRAVSSIGNAPIARAKRLTEPDRPITSGTAAHSFARQQRAGNPLFNPGVLRQTSAKPYNKESKGRDHDPPKRPAAPQTPPLPQAKPESIGLSSIRLQRMSDAFQREIDKGTVPGVT